jgi:hypothetical protein
MSDKVCSLCGCSRPPHHELTMAMLMGDEPYPYPELDYCTEPDGKRCLRRQLDNAATELTVLDARIAELEVATATENPTIPVRIRQNHLTNSPNGAMNGDA